MVRSVTSKIEKSMGKTVELPAVGRVRLPHPDTMVYYVGIGALVALELIEWPIAVVIGAGHMLANRRHEALIHSLGEALEQA